MGQDLAYVKHCKFRSGSYFEAHEYRKITNNMDEIKVSDIFLGTTANFQGSYTKFSLKMGYMVTRRDKIREIPITTWVIQCVDALTMRCGRYLS